MSASTRHGVTTCVTKKSVTIRVDWDAHTIETGPGPRAFKLSSNPVVGQTLRTTLPDGSFINTSKIVEVTDEDGGAATGQGGVGRAGSSGRCTVPVMMAGAVDRHRPMETPGCQVRRCRCVNARRSRSR